MQVKVSYDIDNSHKKVRFMNSSYYHQSNFTQSGCLSHIPFKSLRYLIKLHGDRKGKSFHFTPQFCYLLIIPSNGSIPGYQKVCAFGDWPKLLIFFKAFSASCISLFLQKKWITLFQSWTPHSTLCHSFISCNSLVTNPASSVSAPLLAIIPKFCWVTSRILASFLPLNSCSAPCVSCWKTWIGSLTMELSNQMWEHATCLTKQKAYIMWKEELTIPSKMAKSTSLARYASSCDTLARSIKEWKEKSLKFSF